MICPKCHKDLYRIDKVYKCENNHSYDISKYGYVNLLLSKTNCGDCLDSTNARIQFLNNGYYKPLSECIENILLEHNCHDILDCGCGVGYYANEMKNKFSITGIDISKDAILIASKKDKISSYIVCSSSLIPIKENSFDAAYVIFAPLFWQSIANVSKNGALLIVVTPNTNHLYEIKDFLYENPYLNEEPNLSNDLYTLNEEKILTYKKVIDRDNLFNLIMMTPYMYKTKKESIEKINSLESLEVTIDFRISIFTKK